MTLLINGVISACNELTYVLIYEENLQEYIYLDFIVKSYKLICIYKCLVLSIESSIVIMLRNDREFESLFCFLFLLFMFT